MVQFFGVKSDNSDGVSSMANTMQLKNRGLKKNMLKIENFEEFNVNGALHGMRNPLNSWSKSSPDADLDLAKRLYKAGSEHRKYLRQIMICCDILAPLYF